MPARISVVIFRSSSANSGWESAGPPSSGRWPGRERCRPPRTQSGGRARLASHSESPLPLLDAIGNVEAGCGVSEIARKRAGSNPDLKPSRDAARNMMAGRRIRQPNTRRQPRTWISGPRKLRWRRDISFGLLGKSREIGQASDRELGGQFHGPHHDAGSLRSPRD